MKDADSMDVCDKDDLTRFPDNFPDIGGQSFQYVFKNKSDWVDFTVKGMQNATGFFAVWKSYCLRKNNK